MSTIEDNNDLQQLGGSGEIISSTNAYTYTSCHQNNVDKLPRITNMVLGDTPKCSNCGKEGNSDKMNTCNKCNMAKYCNAACKKKHRKKHKKACEKRVAELHEEALFKEIDPEECPICMITLPHNVSQTEFKSCCGKYICLGCKHAINISEGKDICAFCRTPPPTYNDEDIKRVKKLMSKGNANAFFRLGGWYGSGGRGLPQDLQKANKLFVKAGESGCAAAYFNLGLSYQVGRGALL